MIPSNHLSEPRVLRVIPHLLTPLLILLLGTTPLTAQEVTLQIGQDHEIIIEGTSNVRDWSAEVTAVEGELVLNGFNGSIDGLTADQFRSLRLEMPVGDIESDGRRLTNNIRNYLEEGDHPVITFELNQVNSVEIDGNSGVLEAEGTVTAAGNEAPVTMQVNVGLEGNNLLFSGSQPLNMTDFDIDPPTAVLGTIRAADEMTIEFNVSFEN